MRIWSSDMWHVAEACVDWDCVVEEGDRGVTHSSERSEAGAAAGAEREGTPVRGERREETWRPEHVNTTFRSEGQSLIFS